MDQKAELESTATPPTSEQPGTGGIEGLPSDTSTKKELLGTHGVPGSESGADG